MAIAANPIIPKDGVLTISDGAGTPLTFAVPYTDGDLQLAGVRKGGMQTQAFKTRGQTYSVRETEDAPVAFSFNCHFNGLDDATSAAMLDIVAKLGTWASATSTLPTSAGDAWMVQLAWAIEGTARGSTSDHSLTFKYCTIQADIQEGVPSTLSISGEAHYILGDANSVVLT